MEYHISLSTPTLVFSSSFLMAFSLSAVVAWIFGLLCFNSSNLPEISHHQDFTIPNWQEFANKQQRTAYHFQPPKLWMNDPNAPMYYNGIYHLFYQYNPNGAFWNPFLSWGHSISTDLIHWTGLEIALAPTDPFDINGCWSGSATILPSNQPIVIYTGLDKDKRQVQNLAYPKNLSDPFLREWVKPDYNPVIEPFDGLDVGLFRDPSTGWVGPDGLWRIVVGTEIGINGRGVLYKSRDFVKWARVGDPFYLTNGSGMWECVDFFPLDKKKYVLKVGFYDNLTDCYILGRYDGERDVFVDEDASSNDYRRWKRIDYGTFYASKTFFDEAKQRRILWAWSNETDSRQDDLAKGWAGIQTIPRVLSLDSDGKQLVQWPIEEVESLRRNQKNLKNIELKTGGLVEIKGLTVSQADVEVEFELPSLEGAEQFDANWVLDPSQLCSEKGTHVNGGIGPFGLFVLASDNLEEHTAIFFRVFKAEESYAILMCADHRRSSLRAELDKPATGGFVDIDIERDGKIPLRTLIDHSVVESFGGGGRTCITSRVYPTLLASGNTHLFAFNNGTQSAKISELKAWDMDKAEIS